MKQFTSEIITAAVAKACRNLPVAFAYLYGSQATGQTHTESDVDIALGFAVPDSNGTLLQRAFSALEPAFGLYPEQLDLQDFSRLPLAVRFRVVRDGQLIYLADERRHRELVLSTAAYYHDQKPMQEIYSREFFARHAQL